MSHRDFVLQERPSPLRQVPLLVINTHGLLTIKTLKQNVAIPKNLTGKGTLRHVSSFVNYCPLTFSLVHLPPPLPFVKKQYIWLGGGGGGLMSCVGDHILQEFNPNKPKQKPRRGGGLRQINTCRKVPIQVNFLDDDILHCFLAV